MKNNRPLISFLLVIIILLTLPAGVSAIEFIVLEKFTTNVENEAPVLELNSKIQKIINRNREYDYILPESLPDRVRNHFPDEDISDCVTTECLLRRFSDRLNLSYLISGEINQTGGLYQTRIVIKDIKNDIDYSYQMPLLPARESRAYALNSLYHFLDLKVKLEKEEKEDPLLRKQRAFEELKSQFLIKRELSRRLMVERSNLNKTLTALIERFERFRELAKEKESPEEK